MALRSAVEWGLDGFVRAWLPLDEAENIPLALRILSAIVYLVYVLTCLVIVVVLLPVTYPLHVLAAKPPRGIQRCAQELSSPDCAKENLSAICIITANVCLLPDFAARFNGLKDTARRSATIASRLTDPDTHTRASTNGSDSDNILSSLQSRSQRMHVSDWSQQADIICLQEVFAPVAARILQDQLRPLYPFILASAGQCDSRLGWGYLSSGLFVASRHPIVAHQFVRYTRTAFPDTVATKGVLMLKVPYPTYYLISFIIHVMNHLIDVAGGFVVRSRGVRSRWAARGLCCQHTSPS
jgi:hypothetical protein